MASGPVPPSPGVGSRRRGPKSLPKLPLSAFSAPNTGTSDRFPLPPSPSTIHPERVVDAHVLVGSEGLTQWMKQADRVASNKLSSVVVAISDAGELPKYLAKGSTVPVLAVIVPLDLENGPPSAEPSFLTGTGTTMSISTVFTKANAKQIEGVKWAISRGLVVNVDVRCNLLDGEEGWEALEELVSSCSMESGFGKGAIILSNILPPPRTLAIPLVKLLTHPAYTAYQTRISALSLAPSAYIQYLPPDWNAATPPTPSAGGAALSSAAASPLSPGSPASSQDSKEKKEWKRRIKMYIGPVLEAFGFERIIFGSSPSGSSSAPSQVGDWYELARESFAELGIDQEAIDAVFATNAENVYRVSSAPGS